MTSLPHSTILSMPPLERSQTDLSTLHTMYDHSNHPFQGVNQQPPAHPYHSTVYHSYNYPTPPSPFSSHFQHHHGLPAPYSPISVSPDLYAQQRYPPSNTLPTIPLRYSGMGPISIGRPSPQCVAPQELFRLPSSQSLPSNLIGLGMFSEYSSPGPGESQRLVTPDIEIEGEETQDLASPPSTLKSMSGIEEEEYEKVEMKIEQEVERGTAEQTAVKTKKKCPSGAIRKRSLVSTSNTVKAPAVVTDSPGSEKAKKRSRSSQACEKCRGRKARCFGGIPCNRCIKLKHECIFTPTSKLGDPKSPKSPNKSRRHSAGVSLATRPSFPTKAHTYAPKPAAIPQPVSTAPSAFPSLLLDLPSVNSLGMDFSSGPSHKFGTITKSIDQGGEEDGSESESEEEEESDYEMPGLTMSSSSGSSGPTSHSGSGSTVNTTSMDSAEWTADEGLFQLSPFDELGQFDWGAEGMMSFAGEQ